MSFKRRIYVRSLSDIAFEVLLYDNKNYSFGDSISSGFNIKDQVQNTLLNKN